MHNLPLESTKKFELYKNGCLLSPQLVCACECCLKVGVNSRVGNTADVAAGLEAHVSLLSPNGSPGAVLAISHYEIQSLIIPKTILFRIKKRDLNSLSDDPIGITAISAVSNNSNTVVQLVLVAEHGVEHSPTIQLPAV